MAVRHCAGISRQGRETVFDYHRAAAVASPEQWRRSASLAERRTRLRIPNRGVNRSDGVVTHRYVDHHQSQWHGASPRHKRASFGTEILPCHFALNASVLDVKRELALARLKPRFRQNAARP